MRICNKRLENPIDLGKELWSGKMSSKRKFFLPVCLVMLLFLSGCSIISGEERQGEKLDFTVVSEERQPQELTELLEQKKQEPFRLTYTDEEYLYICVGYGTQETGGYSISIQEVSLLDGVIYVDTLLHGPESLEAAEETPSYPYIVLKLEKREETVTFL